MLENLRKTSRQWWHRRTDVFNVVLEKRRSCAAQRVRLRGLAPRPIPAGALAFRGTPENGQGQQQASAQYTDRQPDDGSVVTSRDTAAADDEVHSSGHTHRQSMSLKDMSGAKEAGGKGETEKSKQPAAQKKRTRTTRQASQTQSLLLAADAPFTAALEAIPTRTGAGLGRLAGRSS
jgi:hypothetical protein